jgi:hypothetical protein
MMPTIRIDDEVYDWLQKQATRPFEDTPNSVLRRIAGIEKESQIEMHPIQSEEHRRASSEKTPQYAYRNPILVILKKHGGHTDRQQVLKELEKNMGNRMTERDKTDIKSGGPRWQKTAEWEVRVMREKGLLKPVDETSRPGIWALTQKGKEIADSLD